MGKTKRTHMEWAPVQLNEAVLASGIEGLVGIEELTDYELINNEIKFPSKVHKKSVDKREDRPLSTSKKGSSKLASLSLVQPGKKSYGKSKLKKQKIAVKVSDLEPKIVEKLIKTPGTYSTSLGLSDAETKIEINEENDHIELFPWTNLFVPAPVAKALIEKGFKEPTEIQSLSLPPAIKGRRDILGAAETGSGKTLAFGIPIIHGILNNIERESQVNDAAEESSGVESDQEDPSIDGVGCVRVVNLGMHKESPTPVNKLWALILTPTRELAVQIKDHLVAALKYTDIKVVVVVGGMSMEKQQRELKRQPHIVVATPGRLWELISQGEPHFNNIADIRYLAIDETDRMTEVNHFPELRSLLESINSDPAKQKLRQNFVFSATLTLVHELPMHVKMKFKKKNKKKFPVASSDQKLKKLINLLGITNPKIIDVTKKTGTSDLLTESAIVCSHDQKDYNLCYFLQRHPGRTLVFCNSISCVRRLASLLSIMGLRPLPIHANMIQKQRLKNLERFRDTPDGLLLATDVAARGLDIPLVQHVIHYQVPRTSETYVHRSGRTARANHEGLTLLLIETDEQRQYVRLMKTLNRDKELPQFPIVSDLMEAVKQRVNLARDIDKMQLEYKRAASKFSWVQKTAEEMDLLLDDDEIPEKVNDRATAVIKRQLQGKQKQLKALLKQSLKVRGFSYKYPSLNSGISTSAGSFQSSQTAIETLKSASSEKQNKRKRNSKPMKKRKKKKLVSTNGTDE